MKYMLSRLPGRDEQQREIVPILCRMRRNEVHAPEPIITANYNKSRDARGRAGFSGVCTLANVPVSISKVYRFPVVGSLRETVEHTGRTRRGAALLSHVRYAPSERAQHP